MASSLSSMSRVSQVPRICDCGLPVVVSQAWTDRNPGRKFYTCPDFDFETKQRGCKFFRWFDDKQTNWQRELILGFKRENEQLKGGNAALRNEIVQLRTEARKMMTKVVMLKLKKSGVLMVVKGGFWLVIVVLFSVFFAAWFM